MNKRHLFLGLLTSLGMVGVAVGGALKAAPTEAKATDTNITVTLAVKASLTQTAVRCHVFTGSTAYKEWDSDDAMTAGTAITYNSVSYTVYTYSFPNTYESCIFRVDSYQTDNLGVAYSQIKLAPGYTIDYVVDTLPSSGYIAGSWASVVAPTYTSDYFRVFVDRQNNKADGYVWTYHYWTASIDYEVPVAGYVDIGASIARYVPYFNVPKTAVGAFQQFKIYASAGAYSAATLDEGATYAEGDNAKLFYVTLVGSDYKLTSGEAASSAQTIKVDALATVFDGYFTCSNDKNNGYGSFATLVDTWVKKVESGTTTWWISGNMTDVNLTDCAAQSDYATGSKTATTTLQYKYDQMKAQYNTENPSTPITAFVSSHSDSSNSGLVVAIVCLSLGLASASFLLLKRKKHN